MILSNLLYDSYVIYVKVSIGMDRVTCSRRSCPNVLLECYCTCDKIMMCVYCFGRAMYAYLIHEECEYEHLDLVGLSTFIMNEYG